MDSKIEEVLQNSAGLDTEESIGQLLKNKDYKAHYICQTINCDMQL